MTAADNLVLSDLLRQIKELEERVKELEDENAELYEEILNYSEADPRSH